MKLYRGTNVCMYEKQTVYKYMFHKYQKKLRIVEHHCGLGVLEGALENRLNLKLNIVENRGVVSQKFRSSFLSSKYTSLGDPFSVQGIPV